MTLESVQVARRFRLSIRIDADLNSIEALRGFNCPKSSADVLITMARHVYETRQGAFTWTGPYGSGKSSLIIAFASLLSRDRKVSEFATRILGENVVSEIRRALPVDENGWQVLPVVGSRNDPIFAIGEVLRSRGLVSRRPRGGWTEDYLVNKLTQLASKNSKSNSRIVLFVDEMGKFLEFAAQNNADIYVFQQLAEVASRSDGRFLIIGILHQAFSEYARDLSSELRDEWAKIQGRFVDLAVNATGDEQIELISRAIQSDHHLSESSGISQSVANRIHKNRPTDATRLADTLENCWPLHPVVACLLGPIARRRFGQNQRSIFGFLNSAEPHGFQHYLNSVVDNSLYPPSYLWDYLRLNLEPSILASPDGHRWALASEAIERCEYRGGDDLHVQLLKTVAVIDLFKERSGLSPGLDILSVCFPQHSDVVLQKVLRQLVQWSLVIYKKYLDAYAIYAGSDFDIDGAIENELQEINDVDISSLKSLAGLQPILAKRHYHETGTLRWFELSLVTLRELVEFASNYRPINGSVGVFVLSVAISGEKDAEAHKFCRQAARMGRKWDIVTAVSKRSRPILLLVRELIAIQTIQMNRPELLGDPVARKEVEARIVNLQSKLADELRSSFESAEWHRKNFSEKNYKLFELNKLASELADSRFSECPRIHNELLNRLKPSGSAAAARNALLRRMVIHEGEDRLGIQGYPAERGLFTSLLENTHLYVRDRDAWRFASPKSNTNERLVPMWQVAINFVKSNSHRKVAVSEIFDIWRDEPFGIKDGLMTVFSLAFLLSQRNSIAIYREGIFRTRFDDVDVDYLVRDPSTIQLRWVNLSELSQKLLGEIADIVYLFDDQQSLKNTEPIDVARGLIKIFEQLPNWTKRTMQLSRNSIHVRELFKRANDPDQLLFNDIPAVVGESGASDIASDDDLRRVVENLRRGLEELVQAYGLMLQNLKSIMFTELHVPDFTNGSLLQLQERAENIRNVTGDLRLEAFVGRISTFDGSDKAFESIVSLMINKLPDNWVDRDIDHAALEIAENAQQFLRTEIYARVKGRKNNRHAIAVIIGKEGQPRPIVSEFQVGESERKQIDSLIKRFNEVLYVENNNQKSVVLGALAELFSEFLIDEDEIVRLQEK